MSRGGPDWGQLPGGPTTYRLEDMAELAVRLGAIPSIDRLGQVIYADGFEDGLRRVAVSGGGTGSAVAVFTTETRTGAQCARLVGGSDGALNAAISRILPIPILSRVGVEFWTRLQSTIDDVELNIAAYDGTNSDLYGIRWVDATNTLSYRNSAGGWTDLAPTYDLLQGVALFHGVKLVVDLSTRRYVRLRLNERTYSLANIAPDTAVASLIPRMQPEINLHSRAGNNDSILVDDWLATQNEP